MRSHRILTTAATVVAVLSIARLDPVDGCYDSYWVQHLRLALRLVKWSESKMDLQASSQLRSMNSYSNLVPHCPLDLQEEDSSVFEKAIDKCLCFNMRVALVHHVRANFDEELNALPASASVDSFYLRHARAKIRWWRRAVALEGDKPMITYYDDLVDRCFTQPLTVAASNHSSNVRGQTKKPSGKKPAVSPTPSPPTAAPTTTKPPSAPMTTVGPSQAPPTSSSEDSTPFSNIPDGSALLVLLGCIVGALVVAFYRRILNLIQDPGEDDTTPDANGYIAIAPAPARAPVYGQPPEEEDEDDDEDDEDPDRPLLRSEAREARVQRSVDATE